MTTSNKGYDDGQPRNGMIAFYAALTVFSLIGVKMLLDSYFARVMDTEVYDKVLSRGLEHAVDTRAQEQADLQKAGLPEAMRSLAQRGRAGSPAITPESGQGKAEISGWSQLPRVLPPAPAPALEPVPVPVVAPTPVAPTAAKPRPAKPTALPTRTAP